MNKAEFDLLLAQDMDKAVADAEKEGIKGIENQIKGCFLYKYLKQKKDSAAERAAFSGGMRSGKRADRYIDLKCAYYLRKIAGCTPEADAAYISAYRTIMGKEPAHSIETAQSAAEDELMAGAVSDYVSRRTKTIPDSFFKKEIEKSNNTPKPQRIRVQKNTKADPENVDILEMYCAFFGGARSNGGGVIFSDEYRNKCVDLYIRMLRDEHSVNAYMPLYIDPSSGAGVYIMGKKRFDNSALVAIFKDKKGVDLSVVQKMLNHSDAPNEMLDVTSTLLKLGFDVKLVSEIEKKHKSAVALTDNVLQKNRYAADWREKNLNNNPSFRKVILTTLKSDSRYRGIVDEIYSDTLYDDRLMNEVLRRVGFSEETASLILRKRKFAKDDMLLLFENCYPCTIRFSDLLENASFGEASYKELDISISARVLICASVNDAFANLSENNDWFTSAYAYLNEKFPDGADECFRGRMSE
ncbi:MAG: hypothetical protein ACI4Q4_06720 [Oscillospiraceae bacterium]